jgi:hypothetical protein
MGALKRIKNYVDRDTLISIYNALIRPHFDYCSEVWDTWAQDFLKGSKNSRIEQQE